MSNGQKDTIYIDIDDEITAVIDKLRNSPHKIVALVLPKRATVFQSVVNMKLLKRTADQTKRNIVLITSETALLPLAGAVGVHVAKTLQSKPEIPPSPQQMSDTAVHVSETESGDVPLDGNAPVGALAGLPPEEDEQIDVDNTDVQSSKNKPSKSGKDTNPQKKKNRKLKIPNFESFRKRLILGGLAVVLLIAGYVVAFMVLPKAKVTIKTDTSNIDTNLIFTANPGVQQPDKENKILPALSKEFRKTDTEKVATTGQKDVGTKATGQVALKNCTKTAGALTVPAGTTLSTSNLAFVTNEAAILPASSFNGVGACTTGEQAVSVTAQNPGEQYNVSSGKTFAVSGFSGVSGTNGIAMSGGTSKIIKIVAQPDVDSAKQKITDRTSSDASEDIKKEFEEENYFALKETLTSGNPTVSSTPNVGDEAGEVTVTSTVTSTMLGVKRDDLKQVVEDEARKQIDTSKQGIRDNGLDKAVIHVTEKGQAGQTKLSLQTIVVAGPELDAEGIKKEIAGKKRGQTQDVIRQRPGIKDVEIAYSPFWVQTTPKSTKKITIVFEKTEDNATNQDQ